jgi:hypothetical protein
MKVYLLSLVITILFIICSMILELKQIKCFDQNGYLHLYLE